VKAYKHQPGSEELKLVTEILHSIGANPAERRKIELELVAWPMVSGMFEEKG
jgi:hypothetical protein